MLYPRHLPHSFKFHCVAKRFRREKVFLETRRRREQKSSQTEIYEMEKYSQSYESRSGIA